MRELLLAIASAALFGAAGYVAAQNTTPSPTEDNPTPTNAAQATPSSPAQATAAASGATRSAAEPDRDTKLRLARMDTSMAAFRKLDKNHDGRISALEAADDPRVAAAFTLADKDKDGYLSPEEFQAIGKQ